MALGFFQQIQPGFPQQGANNNCYLVRRPTGFGVTGKSMSNDNVKVKVTLTDPVQHEYAALRNLGQDMSLVLFTRPKPCPPLLYNNTSEKTPFAFKESA